MNEVESVLAANFKTFCDPVAAGADLQTAGIQPTANCEPRKIRAQSADHIREVYVGGYQINRAAAGAAAQDIHGHSVSVTGRRISPGGYVVGEIGECVRGNRRKRGAAAQCALVR